jgi:hypothetical protein
MYSCREGQDARERRRYMDVLMPRRAGCPRAARRSGMAGSGTMPPRSDAASGRLWFPPGIRAIGLMAEWSCSGLQSRVRRFDSDSGLHLVAEDRAPARLPRKRSRQSRASFSVSSASLRRRRHILVPGSRVIVSLRKICSCLDLVAEDRAPASILLRKIGLLPDFRENGPGRAGPRFPSPPLRYVAAGTSLCRERARS